MNKLPNEILNQVFNKLPIVQKQECMLVCRKWNSIIRNRCLFQTVKLPFQLKIIQKFILLMRQNPHFSCQVEELIIPKSINEQDFLFFLPNLKILRRIEGYSTTTPLYERNKVYSRSPVVPLNGGLQHIEEVLQYSMTDKLLASGYCTHITSLTLIKGSDETLSKVFSYLFEAPMIKYLKLIKIHLTIMDFSLISDSLPLMQQFKLHNCVINGSPFPIDIVPNYALSTLEIKDVSTATENVESSFQQFLVIKYPNLQNFSYTRYCEIGYPVDVISLLSQYLFMLKAFGKYLKSLSITIDYDIVQSLFKALDYCDVRLSDLSLYYVKHCHLKSLGQSIQSRYIKNLSLYNVLNDPFDWIKEMRVLEKLLIAKRFCRIMGNRYIGIGELFSECLPTLTSVSINCYTPLSFHILYPNYYITELDLSGRCLRRGSDIHIGRVFPNLKRLRAEFSELRNSAIWFPYHNFTLLDLETKKNRFAIEMLDDDKKLFFNLEPDTSLTDYSILEEGILPVQQEVFDNMPFVTIVVGSVKNLVLEKVPAYF